MSEVIEGLKDSFDRIDATSFRASTAMEWIDYYRRGGRLRDFFVANKMEKIAVYGYGRLGQMLIDELWDEGLNIEYVIDRKAQIISCPIKILSPDNNLPLCDVIIITVSGYNTIREILWKKGIVSVISLKELLARR